MKPQYVTIQMQAIEQYVHVVVCFQKNIWGFFFKFGGDAVKGVHLALLKYFNF